MDHTREIITFQLGTYANYVGAHFWNQQEANFVYTGQSSTVSEDQLPLNDILYREGRNDQQQTTYTPRLLSVDLAGTLGHLPLVGELYGNYVLPGEEVQKAKQQLEESMLYTLDQLELVEQPPVNMSAYQRDLLKGAVAQEKDYHLAETANSWADYLYARYHPRTLNVLQGVTRQTDLQALGTHAAGTELWQSVDFNEEFCDRIRLYVEECDGLQGFQMLFDVDDGFSGLASKCLEHLNDEYNRCSFVVPLYQPRNMSYAQADARTAHSIRVVNSVLAYNHLSEQATMFTPLSTLESIWRNTTLQSRRLPGLQWQADNLYQTSSILASYLDTITLGYRLRQTPETLSRFCGRVTLSGRKMTAAGLALPLAMQQEQDLIEYLDQAGDHSLLTSLTPGCEVGSSYVIQTLMARGIPLDRLKRPQDKAGLQLQMAAYGCSSISHMLQLYYQCSFHGSLTHAASTPLPLKTQLPFPYEMFEQNIANDGYQMMGDSSAQREPNTRVDSAPVLAAVQSSSKLGAHLDALHAQTHRVQLDKLKNYSQSALEKDEYEAALDQLLEFRDNYLDSQFL